MLCILSKHSAHAGMHSGQPTNMAMLGFAVMLQRKAICKAHLPTAAMLHVLHSLLQV